MQLTGQGDHIENRGVGGYSPVFIRHTVGGETRCLLRQAVSPNAVYKKLYSSRRIPSRRIFDCRVVRFMPKRAAAPRDPAITPRDLRNTFKMYSRSISSSV